MKLGKLEKLDLRYHWKDEAQDFTPWLAQDENIELLGETVGMELEVEGIEKNVGLFRADILCKDTLNDHYVLIENQLEKTNHTHLGQIITYAAGLDAVTIIWITSKFTEEHRAALDWLNRITNESINFFGIEIELYRIGDSLPAPKFNIVSKPNNWTKSIPPSNVDLTPVKALQLEYWTHFKEYMENANSFIKCQKPLPQHWANFAIGRSYFYIMAYNNTKDKRIGVMLVVHGPNAKSNFKTLSDKYLQDSLQKVSLELKWEELPEAKESHISLSAKLDPTDRNDWEEQFKWIKENVEKMHAYFASKIKQL